MKHSHVVIHIERKPGGISGTLKSTHPSKAEATQAAKKLRRDGGVYVVTREERWHEGGVTSGIYKGSGA